MLQKLRTRFLLSHTLPILILTPVMALVLYYLVETQNSLGDLANQLIGQGTLIMQIAQDDAGVWTDSEKARQLIEQVKPNISSRIMLIDPARRLIASSLDADQYRVGDVLEFNVVKEAAAGRTNWVIDYSPIMRTRIVDMAIPVMTDDDRILGVVRLSYDITAIEQRTLPLSRAILIAFGVGALMALLLGLGLARSLNAPLLRLTQAISQLSPGAPTTDLPETGPDEVRLLAENYNAMMHRMHTLEQTRQQLIANVVHELGTPLGALKAAAEALRNGAAEDPALAAELTLGINSQIDQMRLLVDDLALLGESEINDVVLRREWCHLEVLIQSQSQTYAYWAKQKHIELITNVEANLPPVLVDPLRIGQILANLLHNAYKYSPPGGEIRVSAAQRNHSVVIEVKDDGPGIAVEEQARIFELLYRSPRQRNLYKGMGIGLALSKRLAEAHGGSISVQSRPGQGTTFLVALPVTLPPQLS